MPGKLTTKLQKTHALEATRIAIGKDKLVYVLIANKSLRYPYGRSRIVYIGTTKNGISRIATSIANHAEDILGWRGVRQITARVITCKPRQNVDTWKKLERALLLLFRAEYGRVPMKNTAGKNVKELDEFTRNIRRDTLRKKLLSLG